MWVSGRTVSRPLCGCQISMKWRKTTSAAEQRRRRLKCGILVLGVYTAPLWADTLSGRAGGMRQCVYYWLSCWRSQWQQHTQWNRQERRRLFRRAAVALIQGHEMSESNTPETNTCPSFFSTFHYQLVDVYLVLEREWFKQFQLLKLQLVKWMTVNLWNDGFCTNLLCMTVQWWRIVSQALTFISMMVCRALVLLGSWCSWFLLCSSFQRREKEDYMTRCTPSLYQHN